MPNTSKSDGSESLCREKAALIRKGDFWGALELPEGSPTPKVMAALAALKNCCSDLAAKINTLRFWLVDARGKKHFSQIRKWLSQPPRSLLRTYGPHLPSFLEENAFALLDTLKDQLLQQSDGKVWELAEKCIAKMVEGLSSLRVDDDDIANGHVIGVRHDKNCPVCQGTGEVKCSFCDGHGTAQGKIEPAELALRLRQDSSLAACVQDVMKKKNVPSWVTPAEFVEIFATHAEGKLACPACGGSGNAPCPNRVQVCFPLPKGFRDGWIARSDTCGGEDNSYDFVTLRKG